MRFGEGRLRAQLQIRVSHGGASSRVYRRAIGAGAASGGVSFDNARGGFVQPPLLRRFWRIQLRSRTLTIAAGLTPGRAVGYRTALNANTVWLFTISRWRRTPRVL